MQFLNLPDNTSQPKKFYRSSKKLQVEETVAGGCFHENKSVFDMRIGVIQVNIKGALNCPLAKKVRAVAFNRRVIYFRRDLYHNNCFNAFRNVNCENKSCSTTMLCLKCQEVDRNIYITSTIFGSA